MQLFDIALVEVLPRRRWLAREPQGQKVEEVETRRVHHRVLLVRELEVAASLNLKSSFDLELEVHELVVVVEHLVLDNAAEVGLNGPLLGLCAGSSLAVAPPGIGLHMMHLGSQLLEHYLYSALLQSDLSL